MRRLGRIRILVGALLIAVLAYCSVCFYMWSNQRYIIFQPTPTLQSNPARKDMAYQEFHIPSGSGAEKGMLDAWWIPATQPTHVTLLYLHGNDKNMSANLTHAERLHQLGYNVLLIDYRGYGLSNGGFPSEAKVYEDAESAWHYLREQMDIKPVDIFIYGHSLGGAIAINLAVHHPDAAGLIVESTFTSMSAIGHLRYPYLPVPLLLNQRFDSIDKMWQLKIPLLLIHGTWDNIVPSRMSQQLYDAAPQPKTVIFIEGGGHGTSGSVGWVEYRNALNSFIRKFHH